MPERHPLGFRVARKCPQLDVRNLPPHVGSVCEGGGFWLYDRHTGVRYRRITMDDLPPKTYWAMTGRKGGGHNGDDTG